MMTQFVVVYWPGGMSISHSGWWLCYNGANGLHKIKEIICLK